MSFTELMMSPRGPGLLGTIMALFVLLGFSVLFMFASDDSAQGGYKSIEWVIAHQAQDIESHHEYLGYRRNQLEKASVRISDARELARVRRESRLFQAKIASLISSIEAADLELMGRHELFEAYKDEYRRLIRSKAKGETLATLETVNGVIYTNVNIREVTPVGIQIRHENGHKRIPFEELPEAMRDRFQFDPVQKQDALVSEMITREELEAAVAVTDKIVNQAAAQRRAGEARQVRRDMNLAITRKESRMHTLGREIGSLENAITFEVRKTVSRAPIMRSDIANKRREIAELRSQIATLQSQLRK